MSNTRLTEEQKAYIVAHINDRPRMAVAKAAGCHVSTVYGIVRKYGGDLRYDLSRRNSEWERIVRENYATMSGHEIERKFGMTVNRANKIARRLGLKHSAETEARLLRERILTLAKTRGNADIKARARKWVARRRLDEMRMWEGRPRLTRFRLRTINIKAYRAKWHLMKFYGYYACDGEPYTLLYDSGTRRRLGTRCDEAYYSSKYKLKFCGYED